MATIKIMNYSKINIALIISILLSHLVFGQVQSNSSTLSLSEGNEQIRDILALSDGYAVLTYAPLSQELKAHYFNSKCEKQWTNSFPYSNFRNRNYSTLIYEDHLLFVPDLISYAPYSILVEKSGATLKKYKKLKGLGKTIGMCAMDQDIGYLHLDESSKNAKDTYSFSRLSKTTFTVESTAILKLPPLRTGQWKYQKLYQGNIYFSGVNKGYNQDGSLSAYYLACKEDGNISLEGTYNISLKDGKFPVPDWLDRDAYMGAHAYYYFDPEHQAMYVYGFFQSDKKGYSTGLATVKLQHEGFYIHKFDISGKALWTKQDYFHELLGSAVIKDNKTIDFAVNDRTGQINFTMTVATKSGNSWSYKPYLFVFNPKDGSIIAQHNRTIADRFEEDLSSVFTLDPENWLPTRSTGYKGIGSLKDSDPHWVRSMSTLLKGKPTENLSRTKFYTVFSNTDQTVIFELDQKNKTTRSLNVYKYD